MTFDHFYILDKNGNAVKARSVEEWAVFIEHANRQIAYDRILNIEVSTVFLGTNHNYFGIGPPILWETMVFGGDLDEQQRRYSSKESALQGHAEMLAKVRQLVCS